MSACFLRAASEAPKIELRAVSMTQHGAVTKAKGAAVAVIGNVQVSAAEITFDRNTGTLKCLGEVTIKVPEGTLKTTDTTDDRTHKLKKVAPDKVLLEF